MRYFAIFVFLCTNISAVTSYAKFIVNYIFPPSERIFATFYNFRFQIEYPICHSAMCKQHHHREANSSVSLRDEPYPVLKFLQLFLVWYGLTEFSLSAVGSEPETEEGRAYGSPCLRFLHVHLQLQLSLEAALRAVPHTVG